MKLDHIDIQILETLQNDAKVNVKELADRLQLTKTPVYERIKRYERDGVIERYVAIIDQSKMSASIVVFCSVSLDTQKLTQIEEFSKAVESIPEVIECYLMGGTSDFLLKVVVRDLNEYHQFSSGKLAALPNVGQIKSTFVLDEIKRSTVYPIL